MELLGRFSQAELEAIRQAVVAAEKRTSGEIVTYIVGECDPYPEAPLRGGLIGVVLGLGAASLAHWWFGVWGSSPLLFGALPALALCLLGMALGEWVPAVRRALLQRGVIERRVALRAEAAFLEEEVWHTRDRSGILLFLALFEHRAVVLGDAGINARVPKPEWQGIVDRLGQGMRDRREVEALTAAIAACSRLLEQRELGRGADDRDELADEPRLRED
jgi:putative membrane protein